MVFLLIDSDQPLHVNVNEHSHFAMQLQLHPCYGRSCLHLHGHLLPWLSSSFQEPYLEMVLQLVYHLLDLKYFVRQALTFLLLLGLPHSMVREPPFGLHQSRHYTLHTLMGANESRVLQLKPVQKLGFPVCVT